MKIFQVHLRDGRRIDLVAESYRHEGGQYVFDPSAQILTYRPRRNRRRQDPEAAGQPRSSEKVSFIEAEVATVVDLGPPGLNVAEPAAAPNGGPATSSGSLGAAEGPSSLS